MHIISIFTLFFLSSCASSTQTRPVQNTTPEWVDPDTLLEKESLYCYKTLADYNCYQTPQRNQIGRLEGYYGPPPP